MNVRIFCVRVMICMCAQTRSRFILSFERVFWGMEFEPMLTPREKSPPPENFPRGGSNSRRCGQRAQTPPTSYSGPHACFICECYNFSMKLFDADQSRSAEQADLRSPGDGFTELVYALRARCFCKHVSRCARVNSQRTNQHRLCWHCCICQQHFQLR